MNPSQTEDHGCGVNQPASTKSGAVQVFEGVSNANKIIVLAIFTLQGGGAERFVLTLANAFTQLGFQVHVVSFKREVDYDLPDGLHYHYLNYQAYRWLPNGPLRHRLFAQRFDRYVRGHIGPPALLLSNLDQVDKVLHYSKLPHILYVLHNTLSVEYRLQDPAKRPLAGQLAQLYANHPVVGVSQGVIDDYLRHIGPHPNIRAILNPVDEEGIRLQAQAFKPDMPSGYLVHVGKFKKEKDHATLIRAYAASQRRVPLVLVGTGPLQEDCRALASALGVADQVVFAGFQPNPYPHIAHAGCMVLSSRQEGFGGVIAEALALNISVVSADCESGPRELLPKHCLVPVGDVRALAKKMDATLETPEAYVSSFPEILLPAQVAQAYLDIIRDPTSINRHLQNNVNF